MASEVRDPERAEVPHEKGHLSSSRWQCALDEPGLTTTPLVLRVTIQTALPEAVNDAYRYNMSHNLQSPSVPRHPVTYRRETLRRLGHRERNIRELLTTPRQSLPVFTRPCIDP